MSYDVYKAAVLRVLPAAPEIPLEAPPAESFDMRDNCSCPACGCVDAAVQKVEDAEIAKCPQCQCEFSPRMESVSRKVIRRISEHRKNQLVRFMERLPANPPVAGLDPDDYALFRKIVNGGSRSEKNIGVRKKYLDSLKQWSIANDINGYTTPQGVAVAPMSRERAEQRWLAKTKGFQAVLAEPDPAVYGQLGFEKEWEWQ